jgi:hypothetical protein
VALRFKLGDYGLKERSRFGPWFFCGSHTRCYLTSI